MNFAAFSRVFSRINVPTVRQHRVNVDWVDGDITSKLAKFIGNLWGDVEVKEPLMLTPSWQSIAWSVRLTCQASDHSDVSH